MAKKFLAAAILSVFFVSGIEAANVSFLVVESGLSLEAKSNQHSELWESGLLDVFFEAGHIVSNAPILRLEGKPAGEFPQEARDEMDEAIMGGAEYFIVALLDYDAAVQIPQNISLQLFRLNPYKKIIEQQHTGKAFNTTREEYEDLKVAVRGLVPHLNDR
jgi:hypothetical protein